MNKQQKGVFGDAFVQETQLSKDESVRKYLQSLHSLYFPNSWEEAQVSPLRLL